MNGMIFEELNNFRNQELNNFGIYKKKFSSKEKL